MNKIPGDDGWRMSSGDFVSMKDVLDWANEWSKIPGQNCVPRFERGSKEDNVIRIRFNNETSETWSKVGTRATKVPGEPTMVLALGAGYFPKKEEADKFKKYLVMHEFGHALGLGHEHQSPLAPELDKNKVILHLMKCGMGRDAAEEKYECDYKEGPASSNSSTTLHDHHSIMQYPIPEECYKDSSQWVKHGGYEPFLTETDKKEIVAMYKAAQAPAGGQAAGPPGIHGSQQPNGHRMMTVNDEDQTDYPEPVLLELQDLSTLVNLPIASEWKSLGRELGVPKDQLEIIDANDRKVERCLDEMFVWWLRNSDDRTLKVLTDALKRINRKDAADEAIKQFRN